MTWWRPWRSRRDEAQKGIEDAERRLEEAREKDPEVDHLAARLREIRERNNFASMFAAALREHR